MQSYEITVKVVCYNPQWEKLRLTLRSILLQQNCKFKIVISDDGSTENYFDRIKAYFRRYAFEDYELIASEENLGTVRNALQGAGLCEGIYTKGISPGDMLHGFFALRKWIDFMHENPDAVMSFSDAIYYHWEDGRIVTESRYANPQQAFISGKDNVRAYLIDNDVCLGAATLCKREKVAPYLERIRNKVIFAEDNVYRLMCYFGEHFAHFKESSVLYEYGSGISTNGSSVWAERLRKDWLVSNQIMLEGEPCEEARRSGVPEFLALAKSRDFRSRLARGILFPSRLLFRLRARFFPRRTPTALDRDFVRALMAETDFSSESV